MGNKEFGVPFQNYALTCSFIVLVVAGCSENSVTNRMQNRGARKVESDIKMTKPVEDVSQVENDGREVKKTVGQGHAFHELSQKIFTTTQERKKLFKHMGIIYLDRTIVDYAPLFDMDMKKTERYIKDPAGNELLTQLYGQDVESKKLAPMSVRWLGKDVGYGVFAEADISKDQFIGIYTGVVQERDKVMSKDYAWAYPAYTVQGQRISLDAKYEGNEMRFVNHSYKPNSVVRYVLGLDGLWHVCYVALRPIKKGQQILISYGKKYWESRKYDYRELS